MFTKTETSTINQAIEILSNSLKLEAVTVDSVESASNFCRLKIAAKEYEVFGVMFLNSQHTMIDFEIMFRGTINSASVYPREVVKRALKLNATAVLLTHNHPSGDSTPSAADKAITARLVDALNLLDIKVLDHLVVTKVGYTSFAETGLL
jgi:DNA repair protein RadC